MTIDGQCQLFGRKPVKRYEAEMDLFPSFKCEGKRLVLEGYVFMHGACRFYMIIHTYHLGALIEG